MTDVLSVQGVERHRISHTLERHEQSLDLGVPFNGIPGSCLVAAEVDPSTWGKTEDGS